MVVVRVGSQVKHEGKKVRVTRIELVELGEKYGENVEEGTQEQFDQGLLVFDLSNGKWAHAHQIRLN